jgi:hypothetical protein
MKENLMNDVKLSARIDALQKKFAWREKNDY